MPVTTLLCPNTNQRSFTKSWCPSCLHSMSTYTIRSGYGDSMQTSWRNSASLSNYSTCLNCTTTSSKHCSNTSRMAIINYEQRSANASLTSWPISTILREGLPSRNKWMKSWESHAHSRYAEPSSRCAAAALVSCQKTTSWKPFTTRSFNWPTIELPKCEWNSPRL